MIGTIWYPSKKYLEPVQNAVNTYNIPEFKFPSQFAEEEFFLTKGYASPSKKFKLHKWQKMPVDSITDYSTIILCGCVQYGKSLISEVILWWIQKYRKVNSLCVYAKKETIEDVVQDRFRPSLYQIPSLRELWSGDPNDLTIKKLTLNNSIIRIASSHVRDDIASHPAGHIYLSEIAKYRRSKIAEANSKAFDVVKLARGRQGAYGRTGNKSAVFESSPLEIGDPLYIEMNRSGVLNLEWFVPCPNCGKYQMLLFDQEHRQIQEIPNNKGEFDHDPQRIRLDNAARYVCLYCEKDIKDEDRIAMNDRGVWARCTDVIDDQGNILTKWPKTDTISFRWSRLIDYTFKWSECLARFFEASRCGNPILLKDFLNEDMAVFWENKIKEYESNWLNSKCLTYNIGDPVIPEGVLVVVCGIDTQDNRFYFVLRGFGRRKESWLLDCDEILVNMGSDQSKEEVFDIVRERIERKRLYTADGRELFINFGLMDRGGHKSAFVDYICQNTPYLYPYIGAVTKLHPLIEKNDKEGIYLGNTENLSRIVANDVELDTWHLPQDVHEEYKKQFVRQYEKEIIEKDGTKTRKWKKGGDDHYRDCENLIQGALITCGFDEIMFDQDQITAMQKEQAREAAQEQNKEHQNTNSFLAGIQERWNRR